MTGQDTYFSTPGVVKILIHNISLTKTSELVAELTLKIEC